MADVPSSALAIYAHPDDPDVSCGGTLASWAAAGSEIHVCICTDGDKGSADPAADLADLVARRRRETGAAGEVLGVAAHHWLGYPDGEVDETSSDPCGLRARLVALIRTVRPEVVIGADPTAVFFGQHYVNHRDHRAVGWATLDAVAPAAANSHYFPAGGPAHAVRSLLLSGTLEADCWVDITPTVELKARAVGCHVTQIGSLQFGSAADWPQGVVRHRAEEAGRRAGVPYAEEYRRINLR